MDFPIDDVDRLPIFSDDVSSSVARFQLIGAARVLDELSLSGSRARRVSMADLGLQCVVGSGSGQIGNGDAGDD